MNGNMAMTIVPPHRTCEEFNERSANVGPDGVHRLQLGVDEQPVPLSTDEARDLLGDRFARELLLQGVFPRTAGEVLEAFKDAVDADDPLRTHQFFLVGEGTQIAPEPSLRVDRRLRFLVTVGRGRGGPDIMISAFHPDAGTIEIMAWDAVAGGFNYYRTVGDSQAWVFAGNSRHALTGSGRNKGPFESHTSGHFLMKELRLPWVHWDSPTARAVLSVFAANGLLEHPWVASLSPGGAYTLEEDVAIPSIQRWTAARLDALVEGRSEETPRRILEQVLTTLTVNLASSQTSSVAAITGSTDRVDLPDTFFVNSAALSGVLGLAFPPRVFVPAATYAQSLETFDVRLSDDDSFERPGDTHFAFVVPEPAFEDVETLRQAIDRGIVSSRLAACLLMVDFPNPVFSPRREALLAHVPDTPFDPAEDFSQAVADAIRGAEAAQQQSTPEHEFSDLWDVGEDFTTPFGERLTSYYEAFTAQLATPAGFARCMELAESRRAGVHRMPISESPMLFSRTNIPLLERRMRADGTVEEV